MTRKRIFLTGATGIAGRQLVAELIAQNYEVVALEPNSVNLEGCSVVVCALDEIERHAAEIGQANAIVHLASSHSLERAAALRQIACTSALIDSWRKGPFVYASSVWLQAGCGGLPRHMSLDSDNWYLTEKYCNEFQLHVAPTNKGPAIILRPGLFFGPSPARNDHQYLKLIYDRCKEGTRFIFLSEHGLQNFGAPFIGCEDFARAAVDALSLKVGGTFSIASGFCTWRELIEAINRLTGTKATFAVRRDGAVGDKEFMLPQSRRCLDTGAFMAQTGFVPRQSLEKLIEDFVRADRIAAAAKSA